MCYICTLISKWLSALKVIRIIINLNSTFKNLNVILNYFLFFFLLFFRVRFRLSHCFVLITHSSTITNSTHATQYTCPNKQTHTNSLLSNKHQHTTMHAQPPPYKGMMCSLRLKDQLLLSASAAFHPKEYFFFLTKDLVRQKQKLKIY